MIRRKKSSFFEKLTGAINADDGYDAFEDETEVTIDRSARAHEARTGRPASDVDEIAIDSDEPPAELTVDVHQTDDAIILQTIVAGTEPHDLDIDITRDMVSIHGSREKHHEVEHDNYVHRELYWGSFSRNILLPEEIDVEEAKASVKNGLLTINLPKLDKHRKTKLQVHVE